MSIWGEGEKITLDFIKALPAGGKWLNLAAGDGRYVPELLEKAGQLIASDIDYGMLEEIQQNLYNSPNKSKLEVKVMDLTKKFPFDSEEFGGVFCTGTLHLFQQNTLVEVLKEIDRVLKQDGIFLFDFACDYQRLSSNGQVMKLENDQNYNLKDAESFLKEQLKNYQIEIKQGDWQDDLTQNPNYGYKTIGKFLLIKAIKKS